MRSVLHPYYIIGAHTVGVSALCVHNVIMTLAQPIPDCQYTHYYYNMYANNSHIKFYIHLILALGIVTEPTIWGFITSQYPGNTTWPG